MAMQGLLILIAIVGYPIYAYLQHTAGEATPTTYILVGMCAMTWINVIVGIIQGMNVNDR